MCYVMTNSLWQLQLLASGVLKEESRRHSADSLSPNQVRKPELSKHSKARAQLRLTGLSWT